MPTAITSGLSWNLLLLFTPSTDAAALLLLLWLAILTT
uniref:Uncharacterized protein n=1 Tax=Yersinia ruckeri TaxID=29486 RepID=A0A0A8VED3_YERRU|nr:hypothetical protein CSF007_0960 [Yersinia ruckeri]